MKKIFSFMLLSFLLLFLSKAYAGFTQKNDSLVVIPAEKYDSYRPGQGSKTGDTYTMEDSIPGYIGSGYMRANMAKGDGNMSNADTIGIRLSYYVNFVKTGTYYVWARAYFPNGNGDSFFWGLDSTVYAQCNRGTDWRYGAWYWYKADSSFVINSAGTDTINIYGREPNARLDQFILTTSATFNPNTDMKTIAFVVLSTNIDATTGENKDQPYIDDLTANGYNIEQVYSSSLETASQGLVDTLNSANLVIIGRSGTSGDFGGTHIAAWNAIKAPIMLLHPYAARSNRLKWLNTTSITSDDNVGDTLTAKIELPNDAVFTGITLASDSTMKWAASPYDEFAATDGGNGTVVARDKSGNILFERWTPWTEFYNGSGQYPAGYRTLIGNGNDHRYATVPGAASNYYNFTAVAKQVFNNEVARMVNLPAPPPKPVGLGKVIDFVTLSTNVDPATGKNKDQPFIDDLRAAGYTVNTNYSSSIETDSTLIDSLNAANLVIIGRTGSSGDFGGTHKAAWNNITSPVMLMHLWAARNNRLNWLNTGTTTSYDTKGDTISAIIDVPADSVFLGAPITNGKMNWLISPYDYLGTKDGGNGTVLARSAIDSSVFFERWDPWVEFYKGAGDYAAGYRTLIGNGNDHANASAGDPVNYYNFTPAAKQVYMNEVARMVNLPKPPAKPVGLGKIIDFVTLSSNTDPATGENKDQPFIDELKAAGYTVNTNYSSSIETDSTLIDSLNSANLVIIGRTGTSGDFGGTHKTAWNNITSPVMLMHPYAARNNRLNWLNTATTSNDDAVGDTISAKIEVPSDSVFLGTTIAADSTMAWIVSPYDYMGTTDGGNGTVLAREASSSNVLFERWKPWVEFYSGAGDMAAGYRTLIGNGNDHANATNGDPVNYFNFTTAANKVFMNEVARMVNLGKVSKPTAVAQGNNNTPKTYALEQNYPNPFNPTTTIQFSLPENSNVKIDVYDILGRLVTRLVNGNFRAGIHKVQFNASNLASGVYFYKIEAGKFEKVKKLMLLK